MWYTVWLKHSCSHTVTARAYEDRVKYEVENRERRLI